MIRIDLALGLAALALLAGCEAIASIHDLPGPPPPGAAPIGTAPTGAGAGATPSSATPPSCASQAPVCGDGASDCCEAPVVPAGSFLRNYDAKDFTNAGYRATVSAFRLDRFEVTVGRFRAFIAAYRAGWRPASGAGIDPASADDTGWRSDWSQQLPVDGMALEANLECHAEFQTYTRTVAANELRPINCVTWYVAFAFCAWDGGRIPTDAEWGYAAAGGGEQRYYPWNDVIDDDRASYYVDDSKQCFGDRVAGCLLDDVTPVGTHAPGIGKWGHHDLSGNVAEWMRDGDASIDAVCNDCIDPTDNGGGGRSGGGSGSTGVRRVRGGAFESQAGGTLRVAAYETAQPGSPSERIGIRCARAP